MPDPTYQYIPIKDRVSFDSSTVKIDKNGDRVLTDFAEPTEGEKYDGMTASVAEVNVPDLDSNGDPVQSGDGGVLDDPGSMAQFHTKQRFPVGTRTVHYYSQTENVPGKGRIPVSHWDLWEYQTQRSMITGPRATYTYINGFAFSLLASYSSNPSARRLPTDYVVELAAKGGYWFNGKRYP